MPRRREWENDLLGIVLTTRDALFISRWRVVFWYLSFPVSHCVYVMRIYDMTAHWQTPVPSLSPSSMNATVRERLIRAEQKFLLAIVSDDEESYDIFSQEWSQLAHDIENIKASGRLDGDTNILLFEVSRAIENTTLCMLECRAISQESLTRSIGDSIQDIPFDDSSIASPHSQAIAPRHLLFSDLVSSKLPKVLGQQRLLDSHAYCWLMQNIHDPYPNSVQTRIISDTSGALVTHVEHWFQEVRDSIGWSRLSHKFFAGSVTATVAAARRVFLERDKNVSFEIEFAFTAVKAYAETLFLEFPPLQGKDVDTGSVQTIQTVAMGQDHYTWPFLDKSIIDSESMPVPPQVNLLAPQEPLSDLSDSDESEEEDTTPPLPIPGCKRPLSEDMPTSQVADLGRPRRRRRFVVNFVFSCPFQTKADCTIGHRLYPRPVLLSPNVHPLYLQTWASHLSKLFLIFRRRLSRLFRRHTRRPQHRQSLHLIHPTPLLRIGDV